MLQSKKNPKTQENTSVQVTVYWGDNPIHVTELCPPRSFSVGEEGADFTVPAKQLGVPRLELVSIDGDHVRVANPTGDELGSDAPVPLLPGRAIRVPRGDLTFEIVSGAAEARPARAFSEDDWGGALGYFGASFLSVGALLTAMAFFVPPLGVNDGEAISADRLITIQQYLEAAAEREAREERKETSDDADVAPSDNGATGAQAQGAEGAMGKPETANNNARWRKQGPADNPDPQLSRLAEATNFGLIGLLAGGLAGDPNAPTAPWGRDDALGSDEFSLLGNMWGDNLMESGGTGGLGLSDFGDGGGGPYEGIGLGKIETIGGGDGTCTGPKCSPFGRGITSSGHKPKSVQMRTSTPTVSGRLAPEVIQRVVRQNFGRFRQCYERGLMQNPSLEGRVPVRFLISSNGTVASAAAGGSTLPSQEVTNCVVQAFYGISFPKPENGSVNVTYPIMFSPG